MSSTLSVNVFTAPEKAIIGERPRPWGPAMAWDATTSTLIFGENDAVLVDTLTTADEAEALARWIELHHRNLATKTSQELAELYDAMTGLYPDWASNQTWLMFGLG